MPKIQIGARVESAIAERIDELVNRNGKTKTDVIEIALHLGLQKLEEESLAAGFELLGDPSMQDMEFPTGAQSAAIKNGN